MVSTPADRPETERERWERNYRDLLQEVRVAQTGVQILFAFLLILPFSSRFAQNDPFARIVYLIALLASACATALIIGPVAFHRMLFRMGMKPVIVRSAHLMASAGLAFVLIAIVCAVLLAIDTALNRSVALIFGGLTFLLLALLWFAIPAIRRVTQKRDHATRYR